LDLWRGVACLFVVVYHSTIQHLVSTPLETPANSGLAIAIRLTHHLWIGVPMFFVISGYCIAATGDATRLRGNSAKTYFSRRIRRIFPPYWAAVLGFIVFSVLVDVLLSPGLLSTGPWAQFRPWWFDGSQWLGNLTLTETWRHHVFGSSRGHFVGQSWTLCYEEQFYLVMGCVLLAARRRFFLGIVVASLLSLGAWLIARWVNVAIDGFFFDGKWFQFAAGVAVYYWINYAMPIERLCLAGGLAFGTAASLAGWSITGSGGSAAFLFAWILLALRRWDVEICAARILRPLFFCGTICYSLYLVHEPLVRALSRLLLKYGLKGDVLTLFVTIPASVAVSVVAGWCFYNLVERRFLNGSQTAAGRVFTEAQNTSLGTSSGHASYAGATGE
jgi:peptidoglycan/LPS O-acetylase OafA/YrhL